MAEETKLEVKEPPKFGEQVTIKQALLNTFRRNLVTVDGNFSFMKLGGFLLSVAWVITQLPQEGIFIAPAVMAAAKAVMAFGAYLGVVGWRDAMKKK